MIKRYFSETHIEKCNGMASDNANYIKNLTNGQTI